MMLICNSQALFLIINIDDHQYDGKNISQDFDLLGFFINTHRQLSM